MYSKEEREEMIWQFIDGGLSPQERQRVDDLLANDLAFKETHAKLSAVHALLKQAELESPSMRFTKNVMEGIMRQHIAPATKSYINRRVIWGIGLFFVLLIGAVLTMGIVQLVAEGNGEPGLLKEVGALDFSRLLSHTWVNVFLGINVILGLYLLDQYLTMRKKELNKGT